MGGVVTTACRRLALLDPSGHTSPLVSSHTLRLLHLAGRAAVSAGNLEPDYKLLVRKLRFASHDHRYYPVNKLRFKR